MRKEALDLEEIQEVCFGEFGEREGKEEMIIQ